MYKALHDTVRYSEKLSQLSDFAYRVWNMGLICSDMVGRITARPRKFWAEAMPMTPYDQGKLESALQEVIDAKLAHRYEVDGKLYLVFHDHEEHNKGQKNLKYQNKSKYPPPPPSLCFCVTYTRFEERSSTSDDALESFSEKSEKAAKSPSADVHVHVPVLVPVQDKRGSGGEKDTARALAAIWNEGPGEHLNGKSAVDKIQAAIDVGVPPQTIQAAFWDHASIKGRKIWEVLDPLRPTQSNGVGSIEDIVKGMRYST